MTTLAVLGSSKEREALVRCMGKRYALTDIALYEVERKGHTLTLIDPVGYPDSFKALMAALGLADGVVFCVPPTGLDRVAGEQLIAMSVLSMGGIVAYTHENTSSGVLERTAEETRKVLRRTPLEGAPEAYISTTTHEGMNELWEKIDGLCDALSARNASKRDEPTRVVVDQAFNVRGVGCVVLGVVRAGGVSVHDRLTVYPLEREVEVRSIQIHDRNVKSAPAGSRVGLALKGIQPNAIERGFLISEEETLTAHPTLVYEPAPFGREVSDGDVVHLFSNLQAVPMRVKGVQMGEPKTLTGRLETRYGIAYRQDDVVLVASLDAHPQRVVAGAHITH